MNVAGTIDDQSSFDWTVKQPEGTFAMAYRIVQTAALTAALFFGAAIAAQAAPDDEIKYRDGKPVGQTETRTNATSGAAGTQGAPDDQIKYRDGKPVGTTEMKSGSMAGDRSMANSSAKPAKKSMKKSSKKNKSMKKTGMRRQSSM